MMGREIMERVSAAVATNIIPDYASALFYIRSSKTSRLEKLMER